MFGRTRRRRIPVSYGGRGKTWGGVFAFDAAHGTAELAVGWCDEGVSVAVRVADGWQGAALLCVPGIVRLVVGADWKEVWCGTRA